MLNKLIILVGLPGSGKTYYGNSVLPKNGIFLDDMNDFGLLLETANYNETIIVSDPHLTNDRVRENAEKLLANAFPDATIEWLFWENDPTQAYKNVLNRSDDRNISLPFMNALAQRYHPPRIDFPVYNNSRNGSNSHDKSQHSI
jgi:hypothetical protein